MPLNPEVRDFDIGDAVFIGFGYAGTTAHSVPTKKELKQIKRKRAIGFVDFAELKRAKRRKKRKKK